MLFDWLIVGQVVAANPAQAVRGPKHVEQFGVDNSVSVHHYCDNSVSVHFSCFPCIKSVSWIQVKSGVSSSFLPGKSGVGSSFLPEKMNRHRITQHRAVFGGVEVIPDLLNGGDVPRGHLPVEIDLRPLQLDHDQRLAGQPT